MTSLRCDVTNCANNKDHYCCRPDIMVGGSRAVASSQTYCANFIERNENTPQNAVDQVSPNTSLDIHCDVSECIYNRQNCCTADHIDIRTANVNGQAKTECSTFARK